SLLSILLLTLHITDDIVRGISKAESSNTALIVLVVFLYGTLVLAERRSGHVIMLVVGLFAVAMPVVHMRGAHYGEIARSTGGFFFVWTLWALGARTVESATGPAVAERKGLNRPVPVSNIPYGLTLAGSPSSMHIMRKHRWPMLALVLSASMAVRAVSGQEAPAINDGIRTLV